MPQIKVHPSVAYSLISGRLFCKFPDLHQAIEDCMGHAVFTHMIPSAMGVLRGRLMSRNHDLASEVPPIIPEGSAKADADQIAAAFASQLEDKYGPAVEI